MKLTFLLVITGTMALSATTSYSQETKLSLNLKSVTLQELLKEISERSDFSVWYNSNILDNEKKVTLNVKDLTVDKILAKALEEFKLGYSITDKVILIYQSLPPSNILGQVQQQKITGNVSDGLTGEPLVGVNVVIEGTTLGVVTDIDGNYSIDLPSESAVLVFSFVGYNTEKVTPGNSKTLNIKLIPDITKLDEVVVVGYGVQRKRDLTGAVASVDVEELSRSTSRNMVNSLQGRVAGVSIEQSGGAPGESFNVKIRGTGTINGNSPLYVVDDLLTDNFGSLNAADIESIQILKDASAAAIYGSRAANGVIIITTKKGKFNQPVKVDINGSYGFTNIINTIDLTNASEYATLNNLANTNAGRPLLPRNNELFDPAVDTDWQKEVYGGNKPIHDINMSISGGSKDITYSLSANRYSQEGIKLGTDFLRHTVRLNTTAKKGIFKFGENFSFSSVKRNNGFNGSRSVEIEVLRQVPTLPVFNNSNIGGYNGADKANYGYDGGNPVGILNLVTNSTKSQDIFGNFFVDVNLMDGLIFKSSFGIDAGIDHGFLYKPIYHFSVVENNQVNSLDESRSQSFRWIWDNTINYNKVLGKSSFGLMLGTSAQEYNQRTLSAGVGNLPGNGAITVIDAQRNINSVGGRLLETSMLSYFGRATYSYNEKYMLTANLRYDGSSKFPKGNEWGAFPSLSAAWRISSESFWTPLQNIVNDFKLRASWGRLGNQTIDNYGYTSTITNYSDYPFGPDPGVQAAASTSTPGMTVTDFNNPIIQWESTTTKGIGIDAELFSSKVLLSIDVWDRLTEDMLTRVPIPYSVGSQTNPYMNVGSIKNSGLEISLAYRNSDNDFKYEIAGNVSTVKNEVVQLSGAVSDAGIRSGGIESSIFTTTWTRPDYPIGGFWLYDNLGTYKTQEQLEANKITNRGALGLGDLEYRDVNNDKLINELDLVYKGSSIPKLEGGLNFNASYKSFDFSIFFQGVYGNKVFNANNYWLESSVDNYNYNKRMLNYWDPVLRPNSNIPVPKAQDPTSNAKAPSDRWLEDGSYLRLKNIQLGYQLPQNIANVLKMQRLRIFISAQNLYTLTNYTGYDPEVGGDGVLNRGVDKERYPLYKTYLAGIQMSF